MSSEAAGAPLLPDPALSRWTLADFPRLRQGLHRHHHCAPRICTERALHWTRAALREQQRGETEDPVLRQGRVLAHVLRHKRAVVWDDDLLLGSTTSHRVGVVIYPEMGGSVIWPELLTMQARQLTPYVITEDDIRLLDQEIFPFWIKDNIREWTRSRFDDPLGLQLDERFVLYFLWKNHAISHTVADMPRLLRHGARAMAQAARERASADPRPEARPLHEAAAMTLEAVLDYAERLAQAAEQRAQSCTDRTRRGELEQMARAARAAPAGPARTVREALQAIWICFLALHQESKNAGLSIGRLDLWLQPMFEAEMAAASGDVERRAVIRRTVELSGAFMLKATDHLPLVADLGNRLFGGSSSDQVITLGGVREDGESAVCDMTYVLLKATEMLALRDPNMNARVAPQVNPPYYLQRVCEVNRITGATPSLHNDDAVVPALVSQGIEPTHARDWSATGCVEPTVCGRHMGHTNCMMFSLVAPLEMALHDGVHPLLQQQVGPHTGEASGFRSFDELFAAYKAQLGAMIERATEANNQLGVAHRTLHPTPLLSALIQGTAEAGLDVTAGGARYNSSGLGIVGLVDVVDSLVAVKTLVFERGRCTMDQLLSALAADFVGHETVLAEIVGRTRRLGSGDPLAARVADELLRFVQQELGRQPHYRGGRYQPGYWSMSNHVAFGLLSGALPSGRRRGQPFTPGITPAPQADVALVQQMRQIAELDPLKMPNNIAFNVKIAPGGDDTPERLVRRMTAYAQGYFELGGMQLQFNVVSSEALREAMEQPEQHRDLLVRISGYNAYFVTLNRDMQLELIRRVEHR